MTIIAFLIAGVADEGCPSWLFPIAMICDTALLIHFM